ncbi:MAG TPA: hypothetical protein VGX78_00945 [Pirellulales bacterium]|jgi:hypothetical protein|nr:hypothetical protein [Pirellulales bacterium]
MTGWMVLTILHLVGWGFCTLWVLGTLWKERMWGNVINFFNWFQAFLISALAGALGFKVLSSMVGPKVADDWFMVDAIALAFQWIMFVVALLGLKAWSDNISRVKVAFHPVFDGVGNFVACVLLAGCIVLSTVDVLYYVRLGLDATKSNIPIAPHLEWVRGKADGALTWQIVTLFCGHWVFVAVAVAVLSKPTGRLDKPKKAEEV